MKICGRSDKLLFFPHTDKLLSFVKRSFIMPAFFSSVANTLTDYSNYYIDWSRVSELITSASHRYSFKELAERGAIISATALGAYAGYRWADEGFGLGSCLYSMAGSFIGFVVSHTVVIAPLLWKRYQMSQECQKSEQQILDACLELRFMDYSNPEIDKLITAITSKVKETKELNLSDDKHARASQTWGTRKMLLAKMAEQVANDLNALQDKDNYDETLLSIQSFWSKSSYDFYNAVSGFRLPSLEKKTSPKEDENNELKLKFQ